MKLSIEMILYQKKKKKKIFQVKTLSKDVRKTTVQSFMFLSNSFEVCRPLCKQNKNMLFSPLNQWNKKSKHTWISRKIFVFYRKWKIKNTVVLYVRSAAHLQAFWIKQDVLTFARLKCFVRVERRARAIAQLICRSMSLANR